MTNEQVRRVNEAIADCDRYIAKMEKLTYKWLSDEEKRCLEFTKQHKEKLQTMIARHAAIYA